MIMQRAELTANAIFKTSSQSRNAPMWTILCIPCASSCLPGVTFKASNKTQHRYLRWCTAFLALTSVSFGRGPCFELVSNDMSLSKPGQGESMLRCSALEKPPEACSPWGALEHSLEMCILESWVHKCGWPSLKAHGVYNYYIKSPNWFAGYIQTLHQHT